MHPVLFEIGGFAVYTYGLFVALAVGIVFFLAARESRRLGIPEGVVTGFLFVVVIAGLVGGRLGYVATYWGYYRHNPLEIIMFRRGGLAFIGSLLGGLSAGIYYLLYRRAAVLPVLDSTAAYLPLGQAVGRLGCFFNGCCYGAPTDAGWGVVFPGLTDGPVHPSQLYELFLNAGIFVFLFFLLRHGARGEPGRLTGWYLVAYGFGRFLVDRYRAEAVASFHPVYVTQLWALFLVGLGAILLLARRKGGLSWP